MSKQELKPCPFCGIKPKLTDGDYYVAHKTGCLLTQVEWLVGERAIRRWQRRG